MLSISRNNISKLSRILSITLLLSSLIYSVSAEESNSYNFPTGEQEGGGVRGEIVSCDSELSYPVPLAPQNSETLTMSATPLIFFDASQVKQAVALNFVLLNQDQNIVYQNALETNEESKLVSLKLSDQSNLEQLKINSSYSWYLVQECGDSTPKIIAKGYLKRTQEPEDIIGKITTASTIDKISIYQEQNIWYETIDNVTQLKCHIYGNADLKKQLAQIEKIDQNSAKSLNNYLSNNCTEKQ